MNKLMKTNGIRSPSQILRNPNTIRGLGRASPRCYPRTYPSEDPPDKLSSSTLYDSTVYFVEEWTATTAADGDSFITASGTGTIRLPDLYAGTYFLEEVDAPDGFNMLTKPVAFVINNDGSVNVYAASGTNTVQTADGKVNTVDVDTTSASLTVSNGTPAMHSIVIKNEPGSALPDTGGSGLPKWPFFTGLALIFIAGAWMYLKHVRRVRAYNAYVARERRRERR